MSNSEDELVNDSKDAFEKENNLTIDIEDPHNKIDTLLETIKDDIQKDIINLKIEMKEEMKSNAYIGTCASTPSSSYSYEEDNEDYNKKKKKKKIDTLVYDEDHEEIKQFTDEIGNKIEIWSKHKKHRLHKCLWKLKYNRIVSSFYLDDLRRREERWSWMIIVISTFTSGITVANNVENEPIVNYNTIINIMLTISSMSTSLIAAWIKKQRFVEKINEIDKYLLNINSLCEELEIQFSLLEEDRLSYDEFKKKYIPVITKYVTTNPMIPPYEWKQCVKEITLKYPELIDPDNSETNKLWPWYGDLVKYKGEDGTEYNIRKPTTFMKHMKKTNKDKILSSCCHKTKECENVYK
jgi:hypothetical protein